MYKITSIKFRQIFDSRGFPTVESDIVINDKFLGRASVPSGASKGAHEALEKRDNNPLSFFGKGIENSIKEANVFIQKLIKKSFSSINEFDELLDIKIGANFTLALSLAFFRGIALAEDELVYKHLRNNFFKQYDNKSFPKLMMNIINGGAHSNNGLSIQEFMVIPNLQFNESLQAGSEIYHTLKDILKQKGHFSGIGDEGGFAPNLKNTNEAIELVLEAIKKAGYDNSVQIGLDAAASEFYKDSKYFVDDNHYDSDELLEFYKDLCKKYPIISIEDLFDQDDFTAWTKATNELKNIQIVGDDIFVTQKERLIRGINEKAANAILIKPNQVGTISKTIETITIAKDAGFNIVASHRSGETEDTFISDLAVASYSNYIKAGALTRTDRVCKYNQLIRIFEDLK